MQLLGAVNNIFVQLSGSLSILIAEDYTKPCKNLSNATIGKHVRHIIEMFLCLEEGYESGIISYENRKRDTELEQNRETALLILRDIHAGLSKPDKSLILAFATKLT